jgi:response regulator RpfG family c-di-GMP phosphodiesterase
VLGLVAILAGTVSDERAATIAELHDAYVGVVEVLSRYLNSADPKANDQATRVSLLSQAVAARMGLPDKEVDNIRVAALLQDINHIDVTAKVIRKAMGDLKHAARPNTAEHTFHGSDLVCSLGTVLTGAWPLLLDHGNGLGQTARGESVLEPGPAAVGASIIRTVNRYVTLLSREPHLANPGDALNALREDLEGDHNPAVLGALEWVVLRSAEAASHQAAELATACAGDEF